MKRYKRILLLLVCLMMLFSLAGCGGSAANEPAGSAPTVIPTDTDMGSPVVLKKTKAEKLHKALEDL